MRALRQLLGLAPLLADARAWLLLAPALLVLAQDGPMLEAFSVAAAMLVALAGLSHVLRKLLFPYIDLEVVAKAAMLTGSGAGLVFLGVCAVLAAVFVAAAAWMGR